MENKGMSAFVVLAVVMVLNGLVLWGLGVFARSPFMARHRVREDRPRKVPPAEHARNRMINSVVSTVQIFGLIYLFHDQLFTATPQGMGQLLMEAAMILALYDLGYYLMHRFAFHQWAWGRKLHVVHHRVHTPYVEDSLFIHPIETILGLSLFVGCMLVVGPVSVYAFGLSFLVYSVWNLVIHSAIHLPFFPFRAISTVAANHDVHHRSMKSGYYASLTPIFDIIFGTATPKVGGDSSKA